MNCESFREAVGAQPNTTDAACVAHASECANCARYQRELQQMDQLIHRAMQVQVPPLGIAQRRAPTRPALALAASVVLAIGIAVSIFVAGTRDTLAREAIEHMEHEAFAMHATEELVDPETVRSELAKYGLALGSGTTKVSYTMNCPFRGSQIPHLVVQTDRGPATVLVLQNEPAISEPASFAEAGYEGIVMPAPRGVLVVMGKDIDEGEVAQELLQALRYE